MLFNVKSGYLEKIFICGELRVTKCGEFRKATGVGKQVA